MLCPPNSQNPVPVFVTPTAPAPAFPMLKFRKTPDPVPVNVSVRAVPGLACPTNPPPLKKNCPSPGSRVPPPGPRVKSRLEMAVPVPVSRRVPPSRTRLAAALDDAPMGLLDPPLPSSGTASTPPLIVVGPAHGSLQLNADGTFTFTPTPDFHGNDSFLYKVSDGQAESNTAVVNILVESVNDAPIARDDLFATLEDTPLSVALPGVLAGDVDLDGDVLAALLASEPSHGSRAMAGQQE